MEHYKNLSLENIIFFDDDGNKYIEEWTDVLSHSGLYKISTLGRVRNKKQILKWRLKKDYDTCRLAKKGKYSDLAKHRLVGIYFIPNPENKPEVNHINGIKWDNRICNLEWSTKSENTQHAYDNGLAHTRIGEKSNFSKLQEENVLDIRKKHITGNYSYSDLGKIYGVNGHTVGRIIRNETWRHLL